MAYNEEANIGRLLDALANQKSEIAVVEEIIVVSSGCTDRTEQIVRDRAANDPRVWLVVQPTKEGKASAVNLLLRNTNQEVIILESADTLPTPETIDRLIAPLEDPRVGMVGARPVPTNSKNTFMGYAAHFVWDLHHVIAMARPKMGELIAFRNVFQQIPFDTAVDEASIEPLIVGQGFGLRYAPTSICYNRGPERVGEFVKRRRANFAGHLYVRDSLGYRVSTMSAFRSFLAVMKSVTFDWRYFLWGPLVVLLEAYVRFLATYDYVFWKRKPYNWAMAATTKQLSLRPRPEPDTRR